MGVMKRTALAELIDETERLNEWKDPRVAQQAKDAGFVLTKSDISNYRTAGMTQIVPRKIIALARGLHLPAYRVALAVLADAGILTPLEVRTPEDAIHHDHTLSAKTKETLLLLIARER